MTSNNGEYMPWTGGGIITATKRTRPASTKAWRPASFKGMAATKKTCEEGLPEAFRLSTPEKTTTKNTDKPSFGAWVQHLREAIEARGSDPIFRMEGTTANEEIYVLDQCGKATKTVVAAWVKSLRDGSVNGSTKPCPCDVDNLSMSAQFVKNSIDIDMLRKVEHDLPKQASGVCVFAAVVGICTSLSASAVRSLEQELKDLKLPDEPSENVENFAMKVTDVARRLEGVGDDLCPKDLPLLVISTFLGSSNDLFKLDVLKIYNEIDENPASHKDWEADVSHLKSKYRSLKTNGQWTAAKTHKEDPVQALQASMVRLERKIDNSNSSNGNGKNAGGGTSNPHKDKICDHCGKKGHIRPNCCHKHIPKEQLRNNNNNKNNGNNNDNEKKIDPQGIHGGLSRKERSVGPKDGEPHEKTVNGTKLLWCPLCKVWRGGPSAHNADGHKGKNGANDKDVKGKLGQIDDSSASGLRLVSGLKASKG